MWPSTLRECARPLEAATTARPTNNLGRQHSAKEFKSAEGRKLHVYCCKQQRQPQERASSLAFSRTQAIGASYKLYIYIYILNNIENGVGSPC